MPPCSEVSKSAQILGCESAEIVRASRSNRARRPGSAETCSGRILIATVRSRRVSRARYTSPMPPAYARFSEDRLGTLEEGKEADLAVLSQDIFSAAPADLANTQVVMTMVAGKIVFKVSK